MKKNRIIPNVPSEERSKMQEGCDKKIIKRPKLTDFYDVSDPRGCSTSEYNSFVEAVKKYELSKI